MYIARAMTPSRHWPGKKDNEETCHLISLTHALPIHHFAHSLLIVVRHIITVIFPHYLIVSTHSRDPHDSMLKITNTPRQASNSHMTLHTDRNNTCFAVICHYFCHHLRNCSLCRCDHSRHRPCPSHRSSSQQSPLDS